MNILLRNRRTIYYCERIDDNVERFKEPVPIKINFEPTNSSSQIFAFGNVYPLYLNGIVRNNFNEIKFKPGDRCYIYNEVPEDYDELCEDADYIVDAEPLQTLNFTQMRFRRLTSDMNYEQ